MYKKINREIFSEKMGRKCKPRSGEGFFAKYKNIEGYIV